ncbi:MAG: hypothetical protein Hyperionvirus9_71 [Hyperionvirus sp.]|uniref:Uncharacterized protein n=1 Tax=Hyperionvirus sp. TaxID=2487770 RepID=A0A3G5AAP9_9VIRU|nr:MAG: hypothetical protein Hyperionvirus9_71 [Hyperionvirus sp.]
MGDQHDPGLGKQTESNENKRIIKEIDTIAIHHQDRDSTGETGMVKGRIATHKLKKLIVSNILQPAYIRDIKDVLVGRYRWRKIGMCLFIIAVILKEVSMVMIFFTARQTNDQLPFIAGAVAAFGTIFLHLSTLAKGESKQATHRANSILKQLNVEGIPDLETNQDTRNEKEDLDKINEELHNTVV